MCSLSSNHVKALKETLTSTGSMVVSFLFTLQDSICRVCGSLYVSSLYEIVKIFLHYINSFYPNKQFTNCPSGSKGNQLTQFHQLNQRLCVWLVSSENNIP